MLTSGPTTDFDPALAMARQSLYRFAALALLDPKLGSWQQLDALCEDPVLLEAAALVRDTPAAIPNMLVRGERPLTELDPSTVLNSLPASRDQFNEQYESTFGLLVSNACPPYETEYINSKFSFQRSHSLADIAGYYRAFGLEPSGKRSERHDHVVLELEFMALLLERERRAICHKLPDANNKAAVCRNAQSRFLREHLAWWLPAFCKLLGREGAGGFYEEVANFISALIPAERAVLGVEAAARAVSPTPLERPEECEGCMLASE